MKSDGIDHKVRGEDMCFKNEMEEFEIFEL